METNGENSLTPRQLRVIPHLLTCRSIEEACRKAHVSRPTVYGWLRGKAFSREVQKQKNLIYGRAIDNLSAGTDAAVTKLLKLVNSRNENIALRAAQSILTLAIKAKETEDTESQRPENQKGEVQLFSLENVRAAWERDQQKNTNKRKSEVGDHFN